MKKLPSDVSNCINNLFANESEKLLADKFYLAQALSGHSYTSLQRSGWLNHAYSLKDMEWVYSSFSTPFEYYAQENNEIFILLNTGSYAPAHMGHIGMLKSAKEKIMSLGLGRNPIMVLSPSHDKYVLNKSEDIKEWSIDRRMEALVSVLEKYPHKNNEDIFLIDPWESVYCEHPVNFTDVIIKYMRDLDNLNINYKIGYVFGSDNEEFLYAFSELSEEDKNKFYAICVERDGYPPKIQSKEKNILYVNNHEDFSPLKSRDIRKSESNKCEQKRADNSGFYAVRHDARLALKNWVENYPQHEKQLNESFDEFHQGLKEVIEKYSRVKSQTIDLEVQRELVVELNKANKCLNLDLGTNDLNKDLSLNYGRIFIPSSLQDNPLKMVVRPEYDHAMSQELMPGDYVFIDDDIASGTTFNLIKSICAEREIRLIEQVNLAQEYCKLIGIEYKLFDIVDTKDFLFGSYTGGLICSINNKAIRLPYFAKYVNLHTRAKIPYADITKFNEEVLNLNMEFFRKNNYLKLKDLHKDLLQVVCKDKLSTLSILQAIQTI